MNTSTIIQRNNVQIRGRKGGPVLLLLQGFGCDQVIWDRLLPHFTDAYQVVLFDHVGTGGSSPQAYDREKYASLQAYLSDLEDVLEALDLHSVTLVGHSIAGAMGLAAAVHNPRIARLVLICTSACYRNDGEYTGGFEPEDFEGILDIVEANFPLWAAGVAAVITGAGPGSSLSAEYAERMCRLHPAYVRDFLRMSFNADVRQLLPQVAVPVQILQTRGDPLTPEPASQYLHEHLPGSILTRLPIHGNMPHLADPRGTAAAILDFLADVHE